jgi:hypothetical protein
VTGEGAAVAAPLQRSGAERALWTYLGLTSLVVIAAAVVDAPANMLLGAAVVGLVIVAYQRVLLAWRTVFAAILIVIMFIPIRRYTVGAGMPIELEPYRIVIGLVFACWFCALAADPNVRWRATGIELPIGAVLLVMLLSMTLNVGRVTANSEIVVKQFSFFLSYFLLVYFIASVMRSRADVDRTIKVLVGAGGLVAFASLIEWKSGTNLFNWYHRVIPFLAYIDEGVAQTRGSGIRARGTAQHPIALSAALVMLVPLSVYLYQRTRKFHWLAAGGVMTLGALSTGSRTGTTMLIALLVSFLVIKRKETVRLLPYLLPLVLVIQVVMPGTLGTMKSMLNPNYLIKEQSYAKGSGAGRIADLGPALAEFSRRPFFGAGFGTRVADPNAKEGTENQILDDQWLGTLLEIGALGALAFFWLYGRTIRRLSRYSKRVDGAESWLATSIAASLIAFTVGMLTFDAYAFVQVTFLAFIMLGLGAAVTTRGARPTPPRQLRVRRRRRELIAAS